MPNKNIVGRFAISGTPLRFHSSIERVTINSSGEVISTATVSFNFGDKVFSIVSKSFILRYGASIKSCA